RRTVSPQARSGRPPPPRGARRGWTLLEFFTRRHAARRRFTDRLEDRSCSVGVDLRRAIWVRVRGLSARATTTRRSFHRSSIATAWAVTIQYDARWSTVGL